MNITISELADTTDFTATSSDLRNIYSSYSHNEKAIGNLRWTWVCNGRYDQHNPILDKNGSPVGYFVGGYYDIGYTFCCLYSDKSNRFFISHILRTEVGSGSLVPFDQKSSYISVIDVVGKFWLFKEGLKFKRVFSFRLPFYWAESMLIYRFFNDDNSLLSVSNCGFCVIDVCQSSLKVKTLFETDLEKEVTSAAVSPNYKLLVIIIRGKKCYKPEVGKEVYPNILSIYDICSGTEIGAQDLELTSKHRTYDINFSANSSVVSVSSYNQFSKLFKLSAY